MKYSFKTIDHIITHVLVFLVISSFIFINDQKTILYTIRIIFILYMSIRLFFIKKSLNVYMLWAFGLIFVLLSSVLWSIDQDESIFYFIWTLQVLFITILLNTFIKSERRLDFVIKSFVYGGLLLLLRLLIEVPIEMYGSQRIGHIINYNSNDLGLKLIFTALCSLYLITKSNYSKILYSASFLTLVTFSLFSGSRKVLIILILGSLIYGLLNLKNFKQVLLIGPIIVIMPFIIYLSVMNIDIFYNVIGHRIDTMINTIAGSGEEGSTSLRIEMIKTGALMFIESPLIGHGIGTFSIESGIGMYSHNNYIEILTGTGLFGFLMYYSIYVYIFLVSLNRFLKKEKNFTFPLTIITLCLAIEFFLVTYNIDYVQILILISYSFIKIQQKDG